MSWIASEQIQRMFARIGKEQRSFAVGDFRHTVENARPQLRNKRSFVNIVDQTMVAHYLF
jgi:hypothetical protein